MTREIIRFEPSLFKFLRDLKKNNERPWFKANKKRYEEELRGPMLRFIEEFAPHLEKISESFLADARPVGGSLFRIYAARPQLHPGRRQPETPAALFRPGASAHRGSQAQGFHSPRRDDRG